MKITTAIIAVAGFGSRRLPITKTIEKCMLPIGNRPIIDYIVQDCLRAGITKIIFVVNEDSVQIQDFYSKNNRLNRYLEASGKDMSLVEVVPEKVELHFFVQKNIDQKYGTAVPVAQAVEEFSLDEKVLVLMGDDFVYKDEKYSTLVELIEQGEQKDNSIMATDIPKEQVKNYGVMQLFDDGTLRKIVEKPNPEDVNSNLINIGKYVISKEALSETVEFVKKPQSGEYYLTDIFEIMASKGQKTAVVRADGAYIDGGNLKNYLEAHKVIFPEVFEG